MPIGGAEAAKFLFAIRASGGSRFGVVAHVADGGAIGTWTPRPTLVHGHFGVEAERAMFLREVATHDSLDLERLQHAEFLAVGVGAGDVVRALHDLEGDVLMHAVLAKRAAAFAQTRQILHGLQTDFATLLLL